MSTICGKISSPVGAGDNSFDAGVLVRGNSLRSLNRARNPATTRRLVAAVIRSTALNGTAAAGKRSPANPPAWPNAGMVSDALSPVFTPVNDQSSNVTVAGVDDVFVTATAL